MSEHIVKSYENELAALDRSIGQMGGLPNNSSVRRLKRWNSAIPSLPIRRLPATTSLTISNPSLKSRWSL